MRGRRALISSPVIDMFLVQPNILVNLIQSTNYPQLLSFWAKASSGGGLKNSQPQNLKRHSQLLGLHRIQKELDWSGEPREWPKNRAVASFLEFNWIMGCQAWIYGDIQASRHSCT